MQLRNLSGCEGGLGRGEFKTAGGGGGHGGRGGKGYYSDIYSEGGAVYGSDKLPCEFGSGSGNASIGDYTNGGGIIGLLHIVTFHSLFCSLYGLVKICMYLAITIVLPRIISLPNKH